MNSVQIVGNICTDINLQNTATGVACCNFTVAAKREFKNRDGQYDSDFIRCAAYGKTAEFVAKYFAKGKRIGIQGYIQTRSYTAQDGTQRFVMEVIPRTVEFGGENSGDANGAANVPPPTPAAYDPRDPAAKFGTPCTDDDELPFA